MLQHLRRPFILSLGKKTKKTCQRQRSFDSADESVWFSSVWKHVSLHNYPVLPLSRQNRRYISEDKFHRYVCTFVRITFFSVSCLLLVVVLCKCFSFKIKGFLSPIAVLFSLHSNGCSRLHACKCIFTSHLCINSDHWRFFIRNEYRGLNRSLHKSLWTL